ncbi:regulatory protein RecX [Oceanisphaera pacifica]|uniref:Regulatory protein RecX n=1 Tax=Oceanisphaera pacifica TaxID=2818389 RepID=A0ABS3NBX4_9GAMM|nr:regulatory protein RecX [Oceanisphaera pacifica]MBO1518081.1 regulatory protein RecX [Oceanisphaera pacifica]
MQKKPEQLTPEALWHSALGLLSRRDHSRLELAQKLRLRQFDNELINAALDKLVEQQWQCDERFARVQVRQHVFKRHGPMRIRMELKRKGVAESLIDLALEEDETDWFELALACYQSRFRDPHISDIKEKAKRLRYLQSRGFNSDQVRYAFETAAQDDTN